MADPEIKFLEGQITAHRNILEELRWEQKTLEFKIRMRLALINTNKREIYQRERELKDGSSS